MQWCIFKRANLSVYLNLYVSFGYTLTQSGSLELDNFN